MMKFFNDARLRLSADYRNWKEKRAERAAEKKALQAAGASEHGHGRFFLLTVPAMATIFAAFVEVYWAILFCIEATGNLDANVETATGSNEQGSFIWNFAFSGHLPVLIGLAAATAPIVMISMVWLPVQFAMRGFGRWRRGTLIAVGLLANALVIVSGTVVMNHNRQEQVRDGLVVEQQAQANRGAIQAQIDAVNGDLERLTDRRVNNEYAATAANVGAAAYRAQYMSAEALARSSETRRDIIVRALGAAERADALRTERTGLFQQLAQAPTEAAVAANIEDTVGRDLNAFAQFVEVWRPPFVALIATLIGVLGAWWTLAMLQGLNPRDVLRSGWADESHRIEDHSQEPDLPVDAKGPVPPRQRRKVYNPETGREEVFVQPKGYWRSTGKKQKNADGTEGELTEFIPDPGPEDKPAAADGGQRTASVTIGGLMESEPARDARASTDDAAEDGRVEAEPEIHADESRAPQAETDAIDDTNQQTESSDDLEFEDEASDEASTETNDPEPVESVQEDNAEPDQEREPETREDRMLTSSVAAE